MSPFPSVAETVDPKAPDIRILEHWKIHGVNAGLAGTAGGADYRLPPEGPYLPETWDGLARHLDAKAMVVSRQPHGASVRSHQPGATTGILEGVDGHVTREPGAYLAVTVADCVPVYLCHPGASCVGIIHAGWRGVAAGIVEAGVQAMGAISKQSPADLVMHCGISICGSCYEVGPEVWAALGEPEPEGAMPIDLRDVIARRAQRQGVRRITVSPACTAHQSDGLQSHRKMGLKSGRMAAYLGIVEPCTRTGTPVH